MILNPFFIGIVVLTFGIFISGKAREAFRCDDGVATIESMGESPIRAKAKTHPYFERFEHIWKNSRFF
ncbi:MAG: hypothetical protein ACI9XK_004599 [Granulosicoccus sp.]|jgi:hypothetical protein